MCYDQPQTAALCIERWLETNSDQIPSILSAMEQFRRKGVPASPSGWDETIAAAVLHYQLQVAGLST
jgi:hypothetical protein